MIKEKEVVLWCPICQKIERVLPRKLELKFMEKHNIERMIQTIICCRCFENIDA